MEPITFILLAGTGLSVAAALYFWNQIVDYLSKRIVPWVREKLGLRAAEIFTDLIVWLDKGACRSRQAVKAAWEFFKEKVLSMKTTYRKVTADTVQATTESVIMMPDGTCVRRREETTVEWSDLPEDVRREMMRQNAKQAEMDVRRAVEEQAKRRAQEQGMEMELGL